MKKTLEALGNELNLSQQQIEETMPGSFVSYVPIKMRSSDIKLAAISGIIKKQKRRTAEKAIYEFLALEVWNELLKQYSNINCIQFRAPKPISLTNLTTEEPGVLMEYLNGYEINKLNAMKRKTRVEIKGCEHLIPIYPACALHLGALNKLKEVEGLYHSDYDSRHIIISPVKNVSIGVVDVENSRQEIPSKIIENESKKIIRNFEKFTSSPKDLVSLAYWYKSGSETLKLPQDYPLLEKIVEKIGKKYKIDFDFRNMSLNGHCLRV